MYAYCHVSHAHDDRIEQMQQHFHLGSLHPARVLFAHTLDGVLNVSLRASVLAQSVLAAEDLRAGETVEGEVLQARLEANIYVANVFIIIIMHFPTMRRVE